MSQGECVKNSNSQKLEQNPFAYLDRGEFSSELYKIEIKNLPKFYGIKEFRKLLNDKLKLNCCKIKTPKRNSPYAFVCFRNENDRENAINTIKNSKWKGQQLQAIKAKPAPDPLVRKRNIEDEGNSTESSKKLKFETQEEHLKYSTTPYCNIEYQEQLKLKQTEIKNILTKLASSLSHLNPELRQWLDKQKTLYDGLPCKLLEMRTVNDENEVDGYRNKCEFSVGIDKEQNLPTVGFRLGKYANGLTSVGPVDNLKHIPRIMKTIVNHFQNYVRNSKLQVFNAELQTGHLRQLCVRLARPEQAMVIVGIHPQNLTVDELNEFKRSLVEFFTKETNITSLYYQAMTKRNQGEDSQPLEHLWGETHIYEKLLDLKFRISPEAFFQINTAAAEVLYKSAIELSQPDLNSTVLDVCCGTGTIGLCFANKCNQVLGIEIVPQAIIDAKENASLNNITNSEFFTGKAEELLSSVCYKVTNDSVIAIVDPPRAGLHQKAILQLRKITKIKRVLFISCNPNAALKNFIDLGRPESKTLHGEPFIPVCAVGVDMFPHTKHFELVICFERVNKSVTDNI